MTLEEFLEKDNDPLIDTVARVYCRSLVVVISISLLFCL